MQRIAGVKEVAVRESLLAPPIRHILSWIKVNILGMPALEDIVLGASFKDLVRIAELREKLIHDCRIWE